MHAQTPIGKSDVHVATRLELAASDLEDLACTNGDVRVAVDVIRMAAHHVRAPRRQSRLPLLPIVAIMMAVPVWASSLRQAKTNDEIRGAVASHELRIRACESALADE